MPAADGGDVIYRRLVARGCADENLPSCKRTSVGPKQDRNKPASRAMRIFRAMNRRPPPGVSGLCAGGLADRQLPAAPNLCG